MTTTIAAAEDPALRARILTRRRIAGLGSGSALLRVGRRLLAVHDDAFRVTWIDPIAGTLEPVVLRGDGMPLPKTAKPDFEAAVATPGGAIYLIGSGSLPTRCSIARLQGTTVTIYERPDLHDCVRAALRLAGRPNIEGAVVTADRLRLFHRGMSGQPSAGVDLPLQTLDGGAASALGSFLLELGELEGIGLGLTDAALLGDGRIAFAAAAEDTPDAIADGPVVGSVIGAWQETGLAPRAHWARLVNEDGAPSALKVEGLAVDADCRGGWILDDTDDPSRDSELCRIKLAGFA